MMLVVRFVVRFVVRWMGKADVGDVEVKAMNGCTSVSRKVRNMVLAD